MFIISAQNCEYEWEYTSEIFYPQAFAGVPIIVSNVYLRCFYLFFHNGISPHFKLLLSNGRLYLYGLQ